MTTIERRICPHCSKPAYSANHERDWICPYCGKEIPEKVKVKCLDCGMEYGGEDWIDTVLPNEQWETIFPEGNGILCANCIIKRASKLDNIIIAKMTLTFVKDYKCGIGKEAT